MSVDLDHQLVFETKNLVKHFRNRTGTVKAVDGVDLTIKAGAKIGLVGESGSGKSTLMRLLVGLIPPTAGEVRFNGHLVKKASEGFSQLRSQVQVVFQDPRSSLDPRMKVGSIVAEPLKSAKYHGGFSKTQIRDRVGEVIEQVGLIESDLSKYPHEFSGGQRQRIAIARALATNPSVLIADEPVSALDVSVRGHILNLLSDLANDYEFTLLFVSHDLMVVRHMCNELLVMKSGKIVEAGDTEQVYSTPKSDYTKELISSIPKIVLAD